MCTYKFYKFCLGVQLQKVNSFKFVQSNYYYCRTATMTSKKSFTHILAEAKYDLQMMLLGPKVFYENYIGKEKNKTGM